MNTTYGWLYQHYAHPLLEKQRQKAREELEALCREYDLDPEQQISLIDQMEGSCSLSGVFRAEQNDGALSDRVNHSSARPRLSPAASA